MGILSGGDSFETFPANRNEALAMLYLEHHPNVGALTPEELAELYLDAKTRIAEHFLAMSKQGDGQKKKKDPVE